MAQAPQQYNRTTSLLFGGDGAEGVNDAAICGDSLYIIGNTDSNLLPSAPVPPYQQTNAGNVDSYLVELTVGDTGKAERMFLLTIVQCL